MKTWDCIQGSPEWLRLRSGIPTTSEFKKIITPKTGELSKSADSYMNSLLAEWMVGHPFEVEAKSKWMERGTELEAEAVKAFEFQEDRETALAGFITDDSGMIGCSPDRLIGEDALLEIKCPAHTTHVSYMLTKKPEEEYRPQLQGQLWVTGRQAVYIVSYHPELPSVIMRVERNEEYIDKLARAVTGFVEVMLDVRGKLEAQYGPFVRLPKELPADTNPFDIDLDTADVIWDAYQSRMEVTQ